MEQDHSSKVDPPVKSDTMKSTNTDYNTPPESPTMPNPLFKTMGESMEKPPVAPPRYKRKGKCISINASPAVTNAPSPTPVATITVSKKSLKKCNF